MSKIILHLDMNSYFATLEQQAYPNLRGQPLGVAGKGRGERTVVTGASIEAKRFGIESGMSIWQARQLCPQLIIVPADYDRYIFTSQRIFRLLTQFSPRVEIFSIDEAFLDLRNGANWDEAVAIAQHLKQLIRRQIGEWVTCSIGISYGKTLAKLAAALQKPDGLTVIKPENFPAIAQVTPVEKLCGIGGRLQARLNQLGVMTIAQLGLMSQSTLQQIFGKYIGTWLHRLGNGFDDDQLRSFQDLPPPQSIGHSYTLPQDLTSLDSVKKVLLLLAERVGRRLRQQRLIGKTVSVHIRFFDQTGWGQQQTQPEYLIDGYRIYQVGEYLLGRVTPLKPIRLVAITLTDLVQQAATTQPLFREHQCYEQLVRAVDQLNHRYGEFTVYRSQLARFKQRILNLPDGRNKRAYQPTLDKFGIYSHDKRNANAQTKSDSPIYRTVY